MRLTDFISVGLQPRPTESIDAHPLGSELAKNSGEYVRKIDLPIFCQRLLFRLETDRLPWRLITPNQSAS